jgi:hypothetical protein
MSATGSTFDAPTVNSAPRRSAISWFRSSVARCDAASRSPLGRPVGSRLRAAHRHLVWLPCPILSLTSIQKRSPPSSRARPMTSIWCISKLPGRETCPLSPTSSRSIPGIRLSKKPLEVWGSLTNGTWRSQSKWPSRPSRRNSNARAASSNEVTIRRRSRFWPGGHGRH